jgi:RNA polymerase sigma factor (sigma-70 family)
MPEMNDMDLVRAYAKCNSESAFSELVQRHINLVYSVAMRYVGNAQDAQDMTQAVFIILAKKSAGLRDKTVITGWLYETTRFTAINFLRSKIRRQSREQESYMQSPLNDSDTDGVWLQVAPLLEDAMSRLSESERTLLALHFFEKKSGAEAAAALGIEEWAARKRVTRAVEKLRKFFERRGISISAGVLVGTITANVAQAAPAALASSISSIAVTKGALASGSTITIVKGALKLMAWTKAKTVIAVSAAVLLAAGTAAVVFFHRGDPLVEGKEMIERHIAKPLDLTTRYTTPVSDFDQITRFPAWKSVPRGFQVFANVPLQIEGMMCLWGEANTKQLKIIFPEEILDIEVKQKFETLYVYHCSFFASPDETPVCEVVFRYEDKTSVTNTMLYGEDVLDWVANDRKTVIGPSGLHSRLAWVGGSFSPKKDLPVRLCLTEIKNPQPSLEVTSIDLYSSKSKTALCIMAMTTGKSGLMK